MREPLPRTSVVSGVLSGLSVLASALLLELGRNLVMDSFGESAEVQLVASGLRWLAVLLVVLALLYTAYRLTAERRTRRRLRRRHELLAGLDGPPLTGPWTSDPPLSSAGNDENEESIAEAAGEYGVGPDPTLGVHPVAAALRALPIAEYDAATVHAILTAIGMESALLPEAANPAAGAQPVAPGERWTATDLLTQLISDGVLVCHETQRYRLARFPAEPDRATVLAGAIWQAALFALLRHNADRASGWAIGVTTVPFGPPARRWFAVEEPRLRKLVRRCCLGDSDRVAAIPSATAAQLVRICDALDTWYAVRPAPAGRTQSLAAALVSLGPEVLGGHYRAIRLRAGTVEEPPPWRWRPWWRRATGIGARAEHAAGLSRLESAETPVALADAVDRLRAAWWRLPREDLANQVQVLTDLAVAHIHQGRLDAAQDRLELAALRARDDENADGWARVHEIAGAVAWARGEPRGALRCWQRALTVYRDLADNSGIGRCLQHLGAAVLIAPEHGDLVLDGEPAHDVAEVQRYAHSWLAEAERQNTRAAHVTYYLGRAATLRGTAEVPDFERWPSEVREAADQP